ncbi:hypothetical protein ACP4OV_031100 [Aristida adscensionis]
MASMSRVLLAAAVVLSALAAAAAVAAPPYCAAGVVIPRLSSCRWYVNARTGCGPTPPLTTVWALRDGCCRELAALPAECRCRALRDMMDEAMTTAAREPAAGCWQRMAEFAAALVTVPECGLPTIHGAPYCYAIGAEV